ncbi:MAG: acyl-CoA carboxylase subunit beta [Anaerolineaceae bacterium]|nr:acyl-CoA carboxylase subunit beta [Anaerolineaceae bacterium]
MTINHENTNQALLEMREKAMLGGGIDRINKQHIKGKKTARERLENLLDPDTFQETDMFITHRATGFGMDKSHPHSDGVITGWGKIDGRQVYVYAQDFTVLGGSLGENHGRKIARLMDLAIQNGAPIIGLNDSGGARIQEGVDSLAAYGDIFLRNTNASGVVPQISIILGPCAGGAVYSPAITDFTFMVEKTAYMFITGPEVVKSVTHEDVDFESLGGSAIHAGTSGVTHFTAPDEDTVLAQVRYLLSFLPVNNLSSPPNYPSGDSPTRTTEKLETLVPLDPRQPYDIHDVIEQITDNSEFLEVQEEFARSIVVGFGRMDGNTVGIIANQPDHLAGVLDINSSDKGARFIRFCDAFHIPLLTLVDTPGFLPGTHQEYGGIIRHGAKMIFAYAEATVPKVSLILRKAYGGAYIVMSSKHLLGDINFAWPNAEIAVMGPEGAVKIVYRKQIAASEDPEGEREKLIQKYRQELSNPRIAASRGYINDIILPSETRSKIIQALDSLKNKRQVTPARKHGNIPL